MADLYITWSPMMDIVAVPIFCIFSNVAVSVPRHWSLTTRTKFSALHSVQLRASQLGLKHVSIIFHQFSVPERREFWDFHRGQLLLRQGILSTCPSSRSRSVHGRVSSWMQLGPRRHLRKPAHTSPLFQHRDDSWRAAVRASSSSLALLRCPHTDTDLELPFLDR